MQLRRKTSSFDSFQNFEHRLRHSVFSREGGRRLPAPYDLHGPEDGRPRAPHVELHEKDEQGALASGFEASHSSISETDRRIKS